MLKKVHYSIFVMLSIILALAMVGCSDSFDKLKGEWQVIPVNTVELEENKDIINEDNKQKIINDLRKLGISYEFKEGEYIVRANGEVNATHQYDVKEKKEDKIILDPETTGEVTIIFKSDNTAIYLLPETLDYPLKAFFIRKKE